MITEPTDILGLGVWLDGGQGLFQERTGAAATTPANVGGDPVGTWLDQSGNARHFTAPSDAARPAFQAAVVNGQNVVRFDGTNDYLELLSGLGLLRNVPGATVVVVRKPDSVTTAQKTVFTVSTGGTTTSRLILAVSGNVAGSSDLNSFSLLCRRLDADSATQISTKIVAATVAWDIHAGRVDYATGGVLGLQSFANGTIAGKNTMSGTGNTSDTDSNNIRVGCSAAASQFFDGDIAELLVWNRRLTDVELYDIEEWLESKYAIAINRHTAQFTSLSQSSFFRKDLIDDIWSGSGLPSIGSDAITSSVADPLATYSLGPSNLLRVDLHQIDMYDNTPTLLYSNYSHVWYPVSGNGKLAIVHGGHTSISPDWLNLNFQGTTIKRLVEEGYTVVGLRMTPNALSAAASVSAHNAFAAPTTTLNYMRLFAEPTVRMINELSASFSHTVFCGLSGGGWTAALVQAIDTRIAAAVSVAGSIPLDMTEATRDWEQLLPRSTRVAAYDYMELYAMGISGGRAQKQIHNTADSCCFNETSYSTFRPHAGDMQRLAELFGGTWLLEWENSSSHAISSNSRDSIVSFFATHTVPVGGWGFRRRTIAIGA